MSRQTLFWIALSCRCICAFGLVFAVANAFAEAKIYVVRQPDGTIRFTNREPPAGVRSEIFTAHGGRGFSYYKGGSSRGRVYPNLYNEIITTAAREHQLDPALIKAVIHAESAFNPRALSPKGARGLMQLMPGTARDMGVGNAFVPESNIRGGTAYLARLMKRYGRVEHALAAYNAGDEPVQRFNGVPPFSETQNYVRRVLQLKKQYSAASHG